MNIGFLTTGWSPVQKTDVPLATGTNLYRCLQPAMHLHEKAGYNTVIAGGANLTTEGVELVGWDEHTYADLDVLVIQEWLHKDLVEIMQCAQSAGTKVVLDSDDLLWGVDKKHIAYEHLLPDPEKVRNTAHWQEGLRIADAVTCATQFLCDDIKERFNENVFLVRNAVEPRYFARKQHRNEDVHVGWAGGLPWRSGDLEKLNGIMLPYLEKHDFRFMHFGYIPSWGSIHSRLGIPRKLLDEIGLVDIQEYPMLLPKIDIGIVPLKYCPFNEAKSSLKGMEYTAAGIPFVAHASAEYKWFNAGIVARDKKEFAEGLERLADKDEWEIVRQDAYEKLKAQDINVRWIDWKNVYDHITGGN